MAWQGHRGDRKKKTLSRFHLKAPKPKGASQATIISKCICFLPFSHARNKGFPWSDWHQTVHTGSTIILPFLSKFEAIWSIRTGDMSC